MKKDDNAKFYLHRLKFPGDREEVQASLSPRLFCDSKEEGIHFPVEICGSLERVDGEQWFLSLEISTKLSLHCKICNALVEYPVQGLVIQQLIHCSDEKSGVFDCCDLIRDELLLEGDRFQECREEGCPEREFIKIS
ncbi:hypothetical protein [Chlamydia sp.]|uniref:hypothetical protein n=1 Tax=Chlamydia sp. TaxID=35827 RepID=UPI0025BE1F76|nr:hypothetical protein [Chlamydia sp.]MBQ8498545.1 hypothetical protein [Chlamydia sp.]